ncbi:MAG: hypothetical protein QXX20_07650 [Candidatus Thermoplasmatota archaeon]
MIQKQKPAILAFLFLGIAVFIVSLFDIITNQGWILEIMMIYSILIILLIMMLFISIRQQKPKEEKNIVEEFEKTLKGKLHHFKCPKCHGIFAVKKSKKNNKKEFLLTCPDCGYLGRIPKKPTVITAEIPEKKSARITFTCSDCNESVSLWAEGTQPVAEISILVCPYCGKQNTMKQTNQP